MIARLSFTSLWYVASSELFLTEQRVAEEDFVHQHPCYKFNQNVMQATKLFVTGQQLSPGRKETWHKLLDLPIQRKLIFALTKKDAPVSDAVQPPKKQQRKQQPVRRERNLK